MLKIKYNKASFFSSKKREKKEGLKSYARWSAREGSYSRGAFVQCLIIKVIFYWKLTLAKIDVKFSELKKLHELMFCLWVLTVCTPMLCAWKMRNYYFLKLIRDYAYENKSFHSFVILCILFFIPLVYELLYFRIVI